MEPWLQQQGLTWADVQPLPPPAAYNFSSLTSALNSLDAACADNGKSAGCMPVFLKPYFAKHPLWTYDGPNVSVPTIATNKLGMQVIVRPTGTNGKDK